jgi:transposase
VYFLLEREGFGCDLYPASQVKALPGRPKTGKLDSVWLAKITERGSVASSFVPPEDIRVLRTHTRYRRRLAQARTAEMGRCEKLLEDACVKLSSVITSIHGVSGRDMLNAIIAGERDPKVLAQLARRRMRGKIPQLEEALDCTFFTDDHAFILSMMLENIDHLSAQVKKLDGRISVLCEPYERQIAQLDEVPGYGITTAQDLIAGIGVDMSVFPPPGTCAPGPGRPPASGNPAASARARTPPGAATPISAARSARPPSAPGAPRPSSAPGTAAWSPACPRRKPTPPSPGPSW